MLLLVYCEGGHAEVPCFASSSAPALLCRSGAVVQLLLCEEGKSLGHKVLVILEYRPVTRIGVNDQLAVGQAFGQVVGIAGGYHPVVITVCHKRRLLDHRQIDRWFFAPSLERL